MVTANGKEALATWEGRARSFDLALIDIQMPEMNGFEVTAAIRQRELGTESHLPIIALTARAMAGDREKCLAAGMDDYLAKPIRAGELSAALHRLAREPRSIPLPSISLSEGTITATPS